MNANDLIKIIESKTNLKYKHNDTQTFEGASLIPPQGRVFKNVVSLDFRSFYSSIIVSYNLLGEEMSEWLIEMFNKKQAGNKEAKLAMNMIYGLMKHFDINIAKKIAEIGREWIQRLIKMCKTMGYEVIYSHTDSVMVADVKPSDEIMYQCQGVVIDILSTVKNINTIVGIETEYKFKYIYFKEKLDGTFAMNNYIGVNYNDTLVMKGNWKPSMWEISHIKFVKHLLTRGDNTIKPEDLEEYLRLYKHVDNNSEKFINIKDLSILRVERTHITL